jgi:hypothetical protein
MARNIADIARSVAQINLLLARLASGAAESGADSEWGVDTPVSERKVDNIELSPYVLG